jgi:hypothetical protein
VAERYWTGAIETETHAAKVVDYTAGGFAVFAALLLLTLLNGVDTSKVLTVVIFAVPALALLRTKSPIAARILFYLSLFASAVSLLFGAYMLVAGDVIEAVNVAPLLIIGALWVVAALAARRGIQAAKVLRRARPAAAFD